jgi:hypothetical protein
MPERHRHASDPRHPSQPLNSTRLCRVLSFLETSMLVAFVTSTQLLLPRLTLLARRPDLTILFLRIRGRTLLIGAVMPGLRILVNLPIEPLTEAPFPADEVIALHVQSLRVALVETDAGRLGTESQAGPKATMTPPGITGVVFDTVGDQVGLRTESTLIGITRVRARRAEEVAAVAAALERDVTTILGSPRLPDVHAHADALRDDLGILTAPTPLTLFSPLIGVTGGQDVPDPVTSTTSPQSSHDAWMTTLRAAPSVHLDPTIVILIDPVRQPT